MKYAIGFKSRAVVEVEVEDGVKFVKALVDELNKTATDKWYCEASGVLLHMQEVEFVAPLNLVSGKAREEKL